MASETPLEQQAMIPSDPETMPPIVIVKERRGRAWWARFTSACGAAAVLIAVITMAQDSSSSNANVKSANERAARLAAVVEDNRIETLCRTALTIDLEVARANLDLAAAEYDVVENDLIALITSGFRLDSTEVGAARDKLKMKSDVEIQRAKDVKAAADARDNAINSCRLPEATVDTVSG